MCLTHTLHLSQAFLWQRRISSALLYSVEREEAGCGMEGWEGHKEVLLESRKSLRPLGDPFPWKSLGKSDLHVSGIVARRQRPAWDGTASQAAMTEPSQMGPKRSCFSSSEQVP